jgi:hypothetical protein
MLFSSIPQIHAARLRVYRHGACHIRDLIITGLVSREDDPSPRIASLVMRAKLYGLDFSMQDGVLEPLPVALESLDFAT